MAYLPDGFTIPPALPHEKPFWEYCAKHELRIEQCSDCRTFRHPPQPICPKCRSSRREWTQVSGAGEVYTFTIVRQAVQPALKEAVPYNVAVVMLDGAEDVRLASNVIDATPEEMRVGLRVELVWETAGGMTVPRFRKA